MKNAQSTMMDRIAEIENCVLGGFVLDDRGAWVSIADKKTSEVDFLVHLEAGRVLHNGRWVTFADAKHPLPAPGQGTEDSTAPAADDPATHYSRETALLKLPPVPPNQRPDTVDRNNSGEEVMLPGQYPPETKSILVPPEMTAGGTSDGRDDPSDYARETGLFVIDQSVETGQAPTSQSETKPSMDALSEMEPATSGKKTKRMPAFVPPSIPTWEKEESLQKKRGFIVGGIIIATIGIAAIAVIVLQVVR